MNRSDKSDKSDIEEAFRAAASVQAPKLIEEEELDTAGIAMSWRTEDWFNFYWIADVIVGREGVSRGIAERTLRNLCAVGDVRSVRLDASTDDEQGPDPEIIRPSEWAKEQIDLTVGDWIWVFVSGGDVQYWLDTQARAAGRPIKLLRVTLKEDQAEEAAISAIVEKGRTSRKLGLARKAVNHLWPHEPPEALTNPQIEKHVDEWITSHCKKNNLPKPDIGRDTILRAAGRRQ
jgi:hypothetical protein